MSTANAELKKANRRWLRRFCQASSSQRFLTDHFKEVRQLFAHIEIYPLTFRVSIGQTPVTFALNPYQINGGHRSLAGFATVLLNLEFNFHDRPLLGRTDQALRSFLRRLFVPGERLKAQDSEACSFHVCHTNLLAGRIIIGDPAA